MGGYFEQGCFASLAMTQKGLALISFFVTLSEMYIGGPSFYSLAN